MKIGIYHHTFIHGSGIDNVIKEIANRLSKKHNVEINTFFCNRKDCKAKINVLSKAKTKSIFNAYNPKTAIKTITSVKKYDVVMSHMYPINALVSIGKFIYSTPHLAYFWGAPPSFVANNLREKVYFKFLHLTELIIPKIGPTINMVPNKFIKKWNKIKKAEILPLHGVNIDLNTNKTTKKPLKLNENKSIKKRYNIPDNSNVLFTIGRLTYYKGVHTLINILNIVREKHPETYLIVAGPLWDKKYVKYLKNISGKNVIFTGLIKDKELMELYNLCDIYVTCSKWEGQLNAEAMAMKKPYVVFNVTTHKYTLQNNKNGYLIKPYDKKAFAEKIIKLIENKSLRNKLGSFGRKWVLENANYDKITLKLEKVLKKISIKH